MYNSLRQNAQFHCNMFRSKLAPSMFPLNCHHQGGDSFIARTYSNKIVLDC
jgi:hypothetical protein